MDRDSIQLTKEYLFFKSGFQVYLYPLASIQYIQTSGNYVLFQMTDNRQHSLVLDSDEEANAFVTSLFERMSSK